MLSPQSHQAQDTVHLPSYSKCNDEHFLKPDQYVSQTAAAAAVLSDYGEGKGLPEQAKP